MTDRKPPQDPQHGYVSALSPAELETVLRNYLAQRRLFLQGKTPDMPVLLLRKKPEGE